MDKEVLQRRGCRAEPTRLCFFTSDAWNWEHSRAYYGKKNNYRVDDDVSAELLTEHQGALSHRGKKGGRFFFSIIIPAGGLTTVFALLAISLDVHPVVRRRRRSPSLLQIVANACAVTNTHFGESCTVECVGLKPYDLSFY